MGEKRSSSFELLRLVAMFMVVLGHCALASAQNVEPYLGIIDNIGWGIWAFTACAVNLFFLLTGYFSKSSNFKLSRVLKIWLTTIFYSIVLYLVISLAMGSFAVLDGMEYVFPVFLKKYWYMQTYIVVALVAPFIIYALERLDTRKISFLVCVLILFFSVHQTFIKVSVTLDTTQGYGFIWACCLLVVGHWIRRIQDKVISKLPAVVYLMGYILISCAIFATNCLIVKFDIAQGVTSRGNFYAYNSLSVFLQSICLFCAFVRLSEKKQYWKGINYLSRNTLAVYLISAHPLLLYPLWNKYFNMSQWWGKPVTYIILAFVLTAFVMIVCIFIDKAVDRVYQMIGIGKMIMKLDKLVDFTLQG